MHTVVQAFRQLHLFNVGQGLAVEGRDLLAPQSHRLGSRKLVNADGSYTIGHSSSIYMIDRAGGLRAVMPYGHPVDDFVHDLKILLRS